MTTSITKIKLFGPGIPIALQSLQKLETNSKLRYEFKRIGPAIGEEADYKIWWETTPSFDLPLQLCKYLDEILVPCVCRYSISTTIPKDPGVLQRLRKESSSDNYSFLKFFGPKIYSAINKLNNYVGDIPGIKAVKGILLGEYDYAFEWLRLPEVSDITRFLESIDQLLADTEVIYQIATITKLQTIKVEPEKPDLPPELVLRLL